jgi:uncharacterized membrane protein YhaH (DUF805 family)
MSKIFVGPFRYWLVWILILSSLYAMGSQRLHTLHFNVFSALLLAVVVVAYLLIFSGGMKRNTEARGQMEERT